MDPSEEDSPRHGAVSRLLAKNIEILLEQHRAERKQETRTQMMIGKVSRMAGSLPFL